MYIHIYTTSLLHIHIEIICDYIAQKLCLSATHASFRVIQFSLSFMPPGFRPLSINKSNVALFIVKKKVKERMQGLLGFLAAISYSPGKEDTLLWGRLSIVLKRN